MPLISAYESVFPFRKLPLDEDNWKQSKENRLPVTKADFKRVKNVMNFNSSGQTGGSKVNKAHNTRGHRESEIWEVTLHKLHSAFGVSIRDHITHLRKNSPIQTSAAWRKTKHQGSTGVTCVIFLGAGVEVLSNKRSLSCYFLQNCLFLLTFWLTYS